MKHFFLLLTFVLLTFPISAQDDTEPDPDVDPIPETPVMPMSVEDLCAYGLPVVEILTADGVEPSFEIALPDPELGAVGIGIKNADKVPSRVCIYSPGFEKIYDSGEYEKGKSGATVKVRGNTSAQVDKKPYKIKLQKKADLLCRGNDDKFKDKNWVLISDVELRHSEGYLMNKIVGLQWSPESQFVNLIFNGDYRGMYLLVESVERNSSARLDVDEDTGYIAELDAYWWNEDGYIESTVHSPMLNYSLKYPDFEDVTEEQLAYITKSIQDYDNSKLSGTFDQFIEPASVAAWVLGHDILGTSDSAGSNMFFTKYDNSDTTLIKMGNMWDFDTSYNTPDDWSPLHTIRFRHFFNTENKSVIRAYIELWNKISDTYMSDIIAWYTDFVGSATGRGIKKSLPLEYQRWGVERYAPSECFTIAASWHGTRKVWLDTAIAQLEESLRQWDKEHPTETEKPDPLALESVIALGLKVVELSNDTGEITIYDKSPEPIYQSGQFEENISGATWKWGVPTVQDPEASVYIELQTEYDMTEPKFMADRKNWILRRDPDLKHQLAGEISEILELGTSLPGEWVNLFIDGQYRGVYMLSQSPAHNLKQILGVPESSIALTLDPDWRSSQFYLTSSLFGPELNWTVLPVHEEAINISQLESDLMAIETSVTEGEYTQYVNLEKLSDWVIGHDVLLTIEPVRSGLNFAISNVESQVRIQPLAISNCRDAMVMADRFSGMHEAANEIFDLEQNPAFHNSYLTRWHEVEPYLFAQLNKYLISVISSPRLTGYNESVKLDNQNRGAENRTGTELIGELLNYFADRRAWLNREIGEMNMIAGVEGVVADSLKPVVKVSGNTISIENLSEDNIINVYSISGVLIYSGRNREVELPERGVYVITTPTGHLKVMI